MPRMFNISPVRLRKVIDHVYLVSCEEQYDLAMLFLRIQEVHDSEEERFRKKPMHILDYLRYYALEKDICGTGVFSYPSDWAGFNVSRKDFDWVYKTHRTKLEDFNMYDQIMIDILNVIEKQEKGSDFCVIGVEEGTDPDETFLHEMAHSLWSLNDDYKKDMIKALREVKKEHPEVIAGGKAAVKKMGYQKDLIDDESQAYFSTGLVDEFRKEIREKRQYLGRSLQAALKPCRLTFEEYLGEDLLEGPWDLDVIWEFEHVLQKAS